MKSLVFIFLLALGCGVAVGLTREYFLNNTQSEWYDARKACRIYFKDLATINTTEENNRALQLAPVVPSTCWIGIHFNHTSPGTWTLLWSDGETPSFTKWESYQPTYYDKCGMLTSDNQGVWTQHYCDEPWRFYCYRYLILVQEEMTWDEAHEYCRTYYTGLASVTSETSLLQLNLETAQTQTESVWTGLRFMDGIWLWVSGEQLGSLVSLSSCPARPYRCGSLNNQTNTLENRNCNDRLNFVCYWK